MPEDTPPASPLVPGESAPSPLVPDESAPSPLVPGESAPSSPSPALLDEWVDKLATELGLPADVVDITLVLDLARDAAHGIARPAAPLTTFLVGYAAALAGGSPEDVRRTAAIATRLATE